MLFNSLRVQHVVSLQEPMTSFNHFLWTTPNTNTSSCLSVIVLKSENVNSDNMALFQIDEQKHKAFKLASH